MLQYAKKMKQHAKTIFLPSGCCERYIDFSHYPEGAAWFGHGIALAGIGRHVPGYLIDYPKPRRQIVIVVTRGTYSVDTLDKVVTLSAGELFIIPAGIRQRYWTDDDSACLFFSACLLLRRLAAKYGDSYSAGAAYSGVEGFIGFRISCCKLQSGAFASNCTGCCGADR